MAYTKYSLTPANNNAAPPDGAPEGMLPSAVNDTMRDMMAQIRDCGDGIRGGTYTMSAPVITGGSINGTTTITTSGAISYTGTLTGGTGVVNLGSGQFYKGASGNVGIGTSSPSYKLDVSFSNVSNGIRSGDFTATASSTVSSIESLSVRNDGNSTFQGRFGAGYRRSDGTAIIANTALGTYAFGGQWGTDTSFQSAKYLYTAGIYGVSESSFTSATAMATAITFRVGTSGQSLSAVNTSYGAIEAMRIDSSGNVGIGTSSPATKFDVRTAVLAAAIQWSDNTNSTGFLSTVSGGSAINSNTALVFGTGTSSPERMRIDSSGNLLVGKTGSSYGKFEVAASSELGGFQFTGTIGTLRFLNAAAGTIGSIQWTGSTTTYSTSSDYRLKENIAPMTGALDTVAQLKPVTYNWKADGSSGQGFIAHELAEVVPDCVTGEKDATRIEQYEITPAIPATFDEEGNELTKAVEAVMGEREVPAYQGIDTSFLVATLTASIQELKAIVDAQTARIAVLEAK